jgi:hypothetical protein
MKTLRSQVSDRELRRFGLMGGIAIAAVFGLIKPWFRGGALPLWPWAVGALAISLALARPSALIVPYRLVSRAGAMLAALSANILLWFLFYAIVTPAGLVRRWLGGDPMKRSFEPSAASYRVPSRPPRRENIDRPF